MALINLLCNCTLIADVAPLGTELPELQLDYGYQYALGC